MKSDKNKLLKSVLIAASVFNAVVLLFVVWVYPEVKTAAYALTGSLIGLLAALVFLNQKSFKDAVKSKSVRFGANAAITIGLVIAILVVVNFLNFNHFYRKDFTKNKTYSLSDQTKKIVQDLKEELRFVVFVKTMERDQFKGTIDNYRYLSDKVKVEYVDPDRDPNRAKAANVKKYGTILVQYGKKESRVEEITEEKITNAVIKVLKDKMVKVCFLTGHGEKTPDQTDPDSYSVIKAEMGSQNYETKTFSLLEEGKVPQECTVLLVLGPTRAFFEKEIQQIDLYLAAGGRALVAIDPALKPGLNTNKEILDYISTWGIQINRDLILDPTSRLLGVNASVPIVGNYSKEHNITRDFQVTTLFPMASSLEVKPNAPAGLRVTWLAKSTPRSFAKNDLSEIASGKVVIDEKKDKVGPHNLMMVAEGVKGPKQEADKKKQARLIVTGSSQVASNRFVSHGANVDLFLNAISWLADDEDLISIRAKDPDSDKPELSETESRYIQLVTMILLPGASLLLGFLVWFRRRGM